MKLNKNSRMTVICTSTRKSDLKDTLTTLRRSEKFFYAELIEKASNSYTEAKKLVAADKTLGSLAVRDAIEFELRKVVDLSVQSLAQAMNNAKSINDYLFNVLTVSTFTMDKNNNLYFAMKETILPDEQFKEDAINPKNAVFIGEIDFGLNHWIEFNTSTVRAMVIDNENIPFTVKKSILALLDKKDLQLFENKNQNVEYKASLEKFDTVLSTFESVVDSICVLSDKGEFESITKNKEVIEQL